MVEDHSTPFFVSLFVVAFIALGTMRALWGLMAALAAGFVADRPIGRPRRG